MYLQNIFLKYTFNIFHILFFNHLKTFLTAGTTTAVTAAPPLMPAAPAGPPLMPEGPSLTPEGPSLMPEGPPLTPAGPPLMPEGPPLTPEGPSLMPAAPAGPLLTMAEMTGPPLATKAPTNSS